MSSKPEILGSVLRFYFQYKGKELREFRKLSIDSRSRVVGGGQVPKLGSACFSIFSINEKSWSVLEASDC